MHVATSVIFFNSIQLNLAQSQNIEAGKKIALSVCMACHGIKGVSPNPLWPNLAGQKDQYIMKQLGDFRAGRRNDPLMTPQAKALSEEDIKNLAAYFSQLKHE